MSRVDAVGLARQTAGLGTKVTTMEYYVPVESTEVNENQDTLSIDETVGNRFPLGIDYGTHFFELPLAMAPRLASMPRVLSAFLGQPTSVTTTGTTVHTQDPTAATKVPEPHSLFVVRKDPSPVITDLFWDARGNELEINIAPNDFMRANASFIALDLDQAQSAPTVTTDTTNRRKFYEAVVSISTDSPGGGSTFTAESVGGWGVTYSNSLDTDEGILGSQKLYSLPYGNASCEVRFSPRSNLSTHYRRALTTSPTAIGVKMVATGPIISGAVAENFTVTANAVEVTEAPAPVSGADVLKMIEVTAQARLDSTSKFVTFSTTNAVATYL